MHIRQELLLLPMVLLIVTTKPYATTKPITTKSNADNTDTHNVVESVSSDNATNLVSEITAEDTTEESTDITIIDDETKTPDPETTKPDDRENEDTETDALEKPMRDYLPLLEQPPPKKTKDMPATRWEDDWPQPARFMGKAYRYLLHQKLDIGFRSANHTLRETQRGEPFEDSFIGSIDQLRLLPDESPRHHLVFRYAPIPYVGVGYQTDELVIRTETSIPPERRADDRDTDGNLIMEASMPFVFVRYNILGWVEPYVEYGRARYDNTFDPEPRWFAGGRREFVVEDSKATYWSFGLGLTIRKHIVLDIYTRSIETDVDAVYYFRGDSRDPEPFVFPASHRTHGFTAAFRF